ncbi:MAG: GNAT family N-acetyltransferase [Bacteroidales bacterium]|jgi:N-acetylglutamate synthase-like GNAT family acetyltransferase|nr:GNAT family N-acetyltransferase [Bacteroidales bacterium]
MIIRKATQKDTPEIAAYLMLAMEDIVYEFIGENCKVKATQFLTNLICQEATQYSYEYCWIAEIENEIVAVAVVYDGAKLQELREPVAKEIKSMFSKDFNPENETQIGEFYIDCFAVAPHQQGKGVGSKLFRFLIDEYVFKRNETLGLLVDKDNPNAKKLYLKLGFELVAEKTLAGKEMEHLQFKHKQTEI